MTMQTNSNHCATSTESKDSEVLHQKLVKSHFEKLGSDWSLSKSLPIGDVVKSQKYSFKKNGKSQEYDADGGFVYYKNKLVGVCENKHQKSRKNACERLAKYLFIPGIGPKNMFLTCTGPGFVNEDGQGSTGPILDLAMNAEVFILENPKPEEVKQKLQDWTDWIQSEYE
jgi:hypothetical protein